MLTAFRDAVAERARCEVYLEKPCSPDDLVQRLPLLLARNAR